MTTPAIHFGAVCSECRKAIPPGEDKLLGNDDLKGHICLKCLQRRQDALMELSRKLSEGGASVLRTECAECHITREQLLSRTGDDKMYLVTISNVSVLFCPSCDEKFSQKHMGNDSLRGRLKDLSHKEFWAKATQVFRWQMRERMKRMAARVRQ